MADIVTISTVADWLVREFGSASKLNAQVSSKVSTLIDNHIVLNTATDQLLQGAVGGSEQAKIPMYKPAAPAGWHRDTTKGTDAVLRVTDGVTLPVGDNPVATGGQAGGSWTISGLSTPISGDGTVTGNHSHPMLHIHGMAHTHNIPSHNHGMDHTHVIPQHIHGYATAASVVSLTAETGGTALAQPSGGGFGAQVGHSHGPLLNHDHGYMVGDATVSSSSSSTSTSSTADTTSTASNASTSYSVDNVDIGNPFATSHVHTITHDGSWRPSYSNILICMKD